MALRGLDLEVAEGEIFGLLGPNGAGKTTFVKCLLDLIHPTSGKIELFGGPPERADRRALVGFAPEVPAFPRFLTTEEVLRLHGRLAGLSGEEIAAQTATLLETTDLEPSKRVGQLSKGMVRKLALAQAWLGVPKLLVLDEPTTDLDPIGRRDVRNMLVEAKGQGQTVLLNSHLLSEVERVCDRVAIMHNGSVIAQGSIDELVPEGSDLETVFVELVEGSK